MLALLAPSAALSASDGPADDAATMTLILPHALRPGEIAFVEVTVGEIAPGQQVEVTTADGRRVGTVSPFGIRPGAEAGTYALPVPADAIGSCSLPLRLSITRPDGPPRPPTADEVRGVKLTILGVRP